ncbi:MULTISPECIES: nitroreductase [Spongiibacter]|uniref:nitroreductase n=1 Tax=Spongiibacter TaxID=630749 RepID=UPI000C605CD8|nr:MULTISPECIES: nitroreductase [Spongiibacter]MAY37281.1 nitroreductase [Spongiibacter sp.]MBI58212.1 nitroreductase [Spongiibacter sp.]|tara:strand:- start:177 stop:845 length:669 start_codon:yes stop_codon:yes gene_type:complete
MTSTAFADIARQRRSVRGFISKPVEQTLLNRVFETASTAPSNCNTQPWECAVVSGDKLETLRQRIPDAFASGQWTMDFPYDGKYAGVYKERQYQAAADLYAAMGIAREDKVGRNAQFMRNFEFFGAPHVAFIFLPEPFGLREAADCGMFAQNLMLSLTAEGLASCPQTALSFNADLVREVLDIPPENKLLFGISFGYEDAEDPANRCRTQRAPLGECIRFYD